MFSAIITENFYVFDMQQKQFCCVRFDDFFLCGFSSEDAQRLGYDFFSKTVHKNDLPLWKKMHTAVFRYLNDCKTKRDEIDYFSCTFRLQHKYSFISRLLPQMVYQRMKPVWVDNEWRYMICSVESSVAKESGNLCMYNKNVLAYEKYNATTGRWKRKTTEPLTERESAILMLAQQGKNAKEIAGDLCKGYHTIRNQIKSIFSKLNAHSIREAIYIASCHRIIYTKTVIQPQSFEVPDKRIRILLTDEIKQHIQQHLDDGKSIRKAAKLEGIAESAIRYSIKQGKINNNRKN
jgi:DNA-binding CsgD family transcriptional regulator